MRAALLGATTLGLALVAGACAAPPPDPAALLGRAADDLAAAQTLRFALTREGPAATLDPITGARFAQATGEHRAPDQVHARLKLLLGGALFSVDALWLPEGTFVTDPITGRYRKLDAATAFDARAIFGRDGAAGTLRRLRDVTLVGTEPLDGIDAHHIRGAADGAELRALSGGVLAEGKHTVDVWIDTARSRLLRVQDHDPGGGSWTLDLSAFGEPVEIGRP